MSGALRGGRGNNSSSVSAGPICDRPISTMRRQRHSPRCIAGWSADMANKVRVRMYRQGLGDCFLVTFDVGGSEKHMLIDCGTLGATTTKKTIKEVVDHIKTTTGGPGGNGHLDLLIATHEHLDHVSGFRSQDDVFKNMTIDRVWMAWTEDPIDPLAQKIVKYKDDLGAALKQASAALQSKHASAGGEEG